MATTKVTTGGITDATVATVDIADQAVTLAKLEHGTSSNDGKFLRANNGADPSFETVSIPPSVGGSNGVDFNDNVKARFGTGNDLELYHDGTDSKIINSEGKLTIGNTSSDSSVYLQYGSSDRLYTDMSGIGIPGHLSVGSIATTDDITIVDNKSLNIGTGEDLEISHNGTDNIVHSKNGDLVFKHGNNIKCKVTGGDFRPDTGNNIDLGVSSAKWQNVHAITYYGDGSNLTGISAIPSGLIAIWSGATSAIPSGWVICDGSNSTPDLRDKFVLGASAGTGDSAYPGVNPGSTGGSQSGTIAVAVNGNTGWAAQYANASSMPTMSPEPFNSRDRHQHSWGGTYPHSYDKMPPYYALAFIMKT